MDINKVTEKTGSWDRGLGFAEADRAITQDLKQERLKRDYAGATRKPYNKHNRIAYDCVLLVQLRNGARIGEALNAVLAFMQTGQREQEIPAEKHRKKEVNRLVIIPQEIRKADLQGLEGRDPGKAIKAIENYAIRHFGFNTHSLRYAFITHLAADEKQPVNVVASITEHSNVNMLTHYIEKSKAREILRRIAK